jgi:proton-translocating NADH-quinone oxidoreductase chain M
MFIIIAIWGSRQRKNHAAYQFVLYTLFGSIFLLLAILMLFVDFKTFDLRIILDERIEYSKQLVLFILFFLGFAVKIPILPFHVWLPEAHVEAPTAGSLVLAAILLKLGSYGLIRFVASYLTYASNYFYPFITTFCIVSIFLISFIAIKQTDLKKIIAYSSIAHMNYMMIGIFSNDYKPIIASINLMITHGVISTALFVSVGILYDRFKTRDLMNYGEVIKIMPLFSIFFIIFNLSNVGFPFFSNFIGELLLVTTVSRVNLLIGLVLILMLFFSIISTF